MDYRQEYDKWCNDPYFDDQTREELKAIAGDDKEIEDRFYRTLEFGTAGLRGVIGAGTNRMNIYTVRQATQGLANYILAQGGQEKGVAIAHDSRLMADEFTDAAALCPPRGEATKRQHSLNGVLLNLAFPRKFRIFVVRDIELF